MVTEEQTRLHDREEIEGPELEMAPSLVDEQASGGLPGPLRAALAGLAGAVTVTALNEVGRRLIPHAPRMEVLGQRSLARVIDLAGGDPPRGKRLFRLTLAGDLLHNAAYYSMVGGGKAAAPWKRGATLGALAGLGAVTLPRPLGLGRQPGERVPQTQALTVAWYTLAGLASAAVYRALPAGSKGRGSGQ